MASGCGVAGSLRCGPWGSKSRISRPPAAAFNSPSPSLDSHLSSGAGFPRSGPCARPVYLGRRRPPPWLARFQSHGTALSPPPAKGTEPHHDAPDDHSARCCALGDGQGSEFSFLSTQCRMGLLFIFRGAGDTRVLRIARGHLSWNLSTLGWPNGSTEENNGGCDSDSNKGPGPRWCNLQWGWVNNFSGNCKLIFLGFRYLHLCLELTVKSQICNAFCQKKYKPVGQLGKWQKC